MIIPCIKHKNELQVQLLSTIKKSKKKLAKKKSKTVLLLSTAKMLCNLKVCSSLIL